jgi:hypothetical protein
MAAIGSGLPEPRECWQWTGRCLNAGPEGTPMTDEFARNGFAVTVLAEVAGLSKFVCGHATETDCMTAIMAMYPHDRIRVELNPLSAASFRALLPPLKKGEVRPSR